MTYRIGRLHKLGSRLRCIFGWRASRRTRAHLHLLLACLGLDGIGIVNTGPMDPPLGKLTEAEALRLVDVCLAREEEFLGEKRKHQYGTVR